MAVLNPITNRLVWTGPEGEPGYASPPGINGTPANATSWTFDGRVMYYVAGSTPDPGNLQALGFPTTDFAGNPIGSSSGSSGSGLGLAGGGQGKGQGDGQNSSSSTQTTNALDTIKQAFPWIDQLGLTKQLQTWVTQGLTSDAIVAELRQTPQYKQRFPGILRPDGTMRMNEAQYLSTEDNYRQLLKQYGRPGQEYSNPQDFVGLFSNDIDPNEFKQRLDTYDQIQRSSSFVKAAFYVYAGLKITDDQLYQAVANPDTFTQLTSQYQQAVTANPPDYQTFINRATEFALSDTADKANKNFGGGSPTTQALQNTDPAQAASRMDNLYHGLGYGGAALAQAAHMFGPANSPSLPAGTSTWLPPSMGGTGPTGAAGPHGGVMQNGIEVDAVGPDGKTYGYYINGKFSPYTSGGYGGQGSAATDWVPPDTFASMPAGSVTEETPQQFRQALTTGQNNEPYSTGIIQSFANPDGSVTYMDMTSSYDHGAVNRFSGPATYGRGPTPKAAPTPAPSSSPLPPLLSLNELLIAFQNAMIGGAATANGLQLPDQSLVDQFRQAGIDQNRALQGFSQIAQNQNDWSGALARSGLGTGFSQDQLEKGVFLGLSPEANLLQRAQDYDKALGAPQGDFGFSANRDTGELEQRGLRASLA